MRNKIKGIVMYCLEALVAVVFLSPIYVLFTSAFKYEVDIFDVSRLLAFPITLDNFNRVIHHYAFMHTLRNSLIVTVGTVCLTMLVSTFAAYSLARFKFRGRGALSIDLLTFRMFPPIVTAIPLFLLSYVLGLYNTYWILILCNSVFNLPLAVWLIKSFIEDIPISYEEAAMTDGCSRFEVLRYVTFPLLREGLIATITLIFIFSWNEFLFALLFTGGIETRTLPVAAAMTMSERRIYWGESCAIGVLIIVPVLILFLIAEKYIARALTFGMIK